jgi:hypothetical protein
MELPKLFFPRSQGEGAGDLARLFIAHLFPPRERSVMMSGMRMTS